MTIEEVRAWITACDQAGIGDGIPEQVRVLDAYSRLLESRLLDIAVRSFCPGGCRIEPPPEVFCEHVIARRTIERNLK